MLEPDQHKSGQFLCSLNSLSWRGKHVDCEKVDRHWVLDGYSSSRPSTMTTMQECSLGDDLNFVALLCGWFQCCVRHDRSKHTCLFCDSICCTAARRRPVPVPCTTTSAMPSGQLSMASSTIARACVRSRPRSDIFLARPA